MNPRYIFRNNDKFIKELASLINSHSLENSCNTPDFMLAKAGANFLDVFAEATRDRAKWYGSPITSPGSSAGPQSILELTEEDSIALQTAEDRRTPPHVTHADLKRLAPGFWYTYEEPDNPVLNNEAFFLKEVRGQTAFGTFKGAANPVMKPLSRLNPASQRIEA